jgi:tripartite-type tricarboxylate transporter receptor subunit TctC
MMRTFKSRLLRPLLAGIGFACVVVADLPAASYPERPIKIVVPFPPGGTSDLVARIVATPLSVVLKQPMVVDNRPGASGITGSDVVAKSAPDGYTLGTFPSGHAINNSLNPAVPYDPEKSFEPVILVGSVPMLVLLHPSVPANSLAEFIALARARPGQFNYATGGIGASNHLATELFSKMTGLSMTPVPYKGDPPALNDLISNQISFGFINISSSVQFVKAGRLKAVAISGTRRSPVLPEVPTVAEAGVPGYAAGSWHALFAPAGTPKEIIRMLNTEVNAILKMPAVGARLGDLGITVEGGSPENLATFLRQEIAKWAGIIREANVRLDGK